MAELCGGVELRAAQVGGGEAAALHYLACPGVEGGAVGIAPLAFLQERTGACLVYEVVVEQPHWWQRHHYGVAVVRYPVVCRIGQVYA